MGRPACPHDYGKAVYSEHRSPHLRPKVTKCTWQWCTNRKQVGKITSQTSTQPREAHFWHMDGDKNLRAPRQASLPSPGPGELGLRAPDACFPPGINKQEREKTPARSVLNPHNRWWRKLWSSSFCRGQVTHPSQPASKWADWDRNAGLPVQKTAALSTRSRTCGSSHSTWVGDSGD